MQLTVDANLYLEQLESKHAGELFALAESNRVYLGNWMPWIHNMHGIDFIENFITESILKNQEHTEFAFAIFLDDCMVGRIGLYKIDSMNQQAEIGYWIAESHQGNGIISKSSKRLIAFAFNDCGLKRLEIKCAVENKSSQKIPEKLGFKFEAILPLAEKIKDEFHDLKLYSLLKKEWGNDVLLSLA